MPQSIVQVVFVRATFKNWCAWNFATLFTCGSLLLLHFFVTSITDHDEQKYFKNDYLIPETSSQQAQKMKFENEGYYSQDFLLFLHICLAFFKHHSHFNFFHTNLDNGIISSSRKVKSADRRLSYIKKCLYQPRQETISS